jgi:hypothetical protein
MSAVIHRCALVHDVQSDGTRSNQVKLQVAGTGMDHGPGDEEDDLPPIDDDDADD